jgi:hypothetical protein
MLLLSGAIKYKQIVGHGFYFTKISPSLTEAAKPVSAIDLSTEKPSLERYMVVETRKDEPGAEAKVEEEKAKAETNIEDESPQNQTEPAIEKEAEIMIEPASKITEILLEHETITEEKPSWNGLEEGQVLEETLQYRYCACVKCCGNKKEFITAGGMIIWNGMEDPYILACNWIPLGSVLLIGEHYYTVMDRGGSTLKKVGNVDIFTPAGHLTCFEPGLIENEPITIVKINN